jgi:flagellar motor protein MotB
MKRSKNTASYTIEELFKKNSQKTIHQDQPDDEDDLLLALRLSEQEQVNEQRRLLEQFSQLSQRSISKQNAKAKKRAIQPLEEEKEKEDEDQWFQTVSSRPQPAYKILKQKNKTLESKKRIEKKLPLRHNKDTEETSLLKPVKTEKDNDEIVLDIDDMSEWLQAKEEPEQAEEDDLVIEDMSEWLRAKDEPDTEPDLIIDDMSEWLRVKEEDEPEITSIPTVEEVEVCK